MGGRDRSGRFAAPVDPRTPGPAEPELPAAYEAVHAAIAQEEQRLVELWGRLERERADVEALESLTIRSIRSRLRGSVEVDLAAERADVQAIEAEVALRLDAIDALRAGPGRSTVELADEAVARAERDLVAAMGWWMEEHIAAGSPLGRRLADLDRLGSHLRAVRREVHEALDVAHLAHGSLDMVRETRPAAIAQAQRWLLELRAEIADIVGLREVDGPELSLPSLDLGPGDLFDDWIVGDRVVSSTIAVHATRVRVERVAAELEALVVRLDAGIADLERQAWDLLIEHPGVL